MVTPAFMSEDLARELPAAEVAWLESGGHVVSKTEPDAFNKILRDWLLARAA
jgi:pimeloyl-ACP methyl ester carboxylesterase